MINVRLKGSFNTITPSSTDIKGIRNVTNETNTESKCDELSQK